MAISLTHTTAADGTFSGDGATAWDEAHTLTMATARLLGRTTASAGAVEEIEVGSNLTLSAQTLSAAGYIVPSSAVFQLGAADAGAPSAQKLSVQSVIAGTSNTAGPDFSVYGAASTGNALGGAIKFYTSPAGTAGTSQNAGVLALTIDSSGGVIGANSGSFTIGNDNKFDSTYFYGVGFKFGTAFSGTTILQADAANTLALRNSTNAQRLNIYTSYTDVSNYTRLSLYSTSGYAYIYHDRAGTGPTAAGIIISSPGIGAFQVGSFVVQNIVGSGMWGVDANKTLYPAATLATTMTTGFLNIPGAAGAPSGTPATTTGFPFYYDSTNNQIYVYNGSWRSTAALT